MQSTRHNVARWHDYHFFKAKISIAAFLLFFYYQISGKNFWSQPSRTYLRILGCCRSWSSFGLYWKMWIALQLSSQWWSTQNYFQWSFLIYKTIYIHSESIYFLRSNKDKETIIICCSKPCFLSFENKSQLITWLQIQLR